MSDTLEMLLMRLAGLKQVVLTRWAEQQQDDDDFELGEDYQPWLALESDVNGIWLCSYYVRPDEATERIIQEAGATPPPAAGRTCTLMRRRMRRPSPRAVRLAFGHIGGEWRHSAAL